MSTLRIAAAGKMERGKKPKQDKVKKPQGRPIVAVSLPRTDLAGVPAAGADAPTVQAFVRGQEASLFEPFVASDKQRMTAKFKAGVDMDAVVVLFSRTQQWVQAFQLANETEAVLAVQRFQTQLRSANRVRQTQ